MMFLHAAIISNICTDPNVEKTTIKVFEKARWVDIKKAIPEALVHLRYNSKENFVGQRIEGYHANVAYLRLEVADALKRAAHRLKDLGYNIVVYDTYRPFRAVKHFVRWGNDMTALQKKAEYYPYVDKAHIFDEGYLSLDSHHCRGNTIDLTIIPIGQRLHPIKKIKRKLSDGTEVLYLDDGSCDMYTSFDYFGRASHSGDNDLIPDKEALAKRKILHDAMSSEGFVVSQREWWHFSYTQKDEPIERYDFDVKRYPAFGITFLG